MSTQTLKELARRELLAWNEGRIDVIDEIFAPTYVNHFTGETPAVLKQKVAAVRAAFPDVQVAIDDQMVEGDRVVSRWTARGTQEGDFMGAPATHKRMEQTGISIMRVQESKIVEGWSRADDLGLLQQLGLIPATSIHENKAVIRRFVKEVLNDKNLAVIDEICPPDYVELDPLPGQGPGAAGLKQFLADSFFSAFPDLAWVNEEMVAEGEYVMARSTWTGTHRGEFLGIPPTHRTVKVAAWTIDHVVDGKFVDSRIMVDALGLLQQLGALTPWPPPAKTFQGMADEAYRAVPTLKAADLQRRLDKEPALLVIDVRDAAEVAQTGTIPGAINLSYGALTYLADHAAPEDWRDPRLADHARPIVTTCGLGPLGALGGKLLHDMGFTDVQILEGGVQAWIDAGLPVTQ